MTETKADYYVLTTPESVTIMYHCPLCFKWKRHNQLSLGAREYLVCHTCGTVLWFKRKSPNA